MVFDFFALFLYLIGFIKFPHDNPKAQNWFCQNIIFCFSFCFAVYLIPGVFWQKLVESQSSQWIPPAKYYSYFNPEHEIKNIYKDYQKGLDYAKKVNKPVMIDFTGQACVNCRKIEEAVWIDKDVKSILDNEYVVISLYVDEKTILPIESQETVDIITRDGNIKKRKLKQLEINGVPFKV